MLYSVIFDIFSENHYAAAAFILLSAFLTSFVVAVLSGTPIISLLIKFGLIEHTENTPIEDEDLKEQVSAKQNIPTMGGVIIGIGLIAGILVGGNLTSLQMWLCLTAFTTLAILGAFDDIMKVKDKGHRGRGLKVRYKLLFQGVLGFGLSILYLHHLHNASVELTQQMLPGRALITSHTVLFGITGAFILAVMSNAVNVTDGMDGLAGGLVIAALLPIILITVIFNLPEFAINSGAAVFCAALCGAVLGFLWHNTYPAKVFMGDTGSMAIGAGLGTAAFFSGIELLLPLIALVMLADFASSVIQVVYFKATGRRIFPIAPFHHIFQQKRWSETHTVVRLWIAGGLCSLIALTIATAL